MHFYFYETQENLEDWVEESRKYQALATKIQTEAYRRDPRMISIAILLFIDAWPSGWMKTIVDCEREPKPAFFAYRDARLLDVDYDVSDLCVDYRDRAADNEAEIFEMLFYLGASAYLSDNIFFANLCEHQRHHAENLFSLCFLN